MRIEYLREFILAAQLRNYSRAAAELNITQPSLSKHIQDVEREIGFELFDRSARNIRVTSAGKLFFNEIVRLLSDYDESLERIRCQIRQADPRQEVVVESNRISPLIRKLTSLAAVQATNSFDDIEIAYRSDIMMVDDCLVRDVERLLRDEEADVAIAHVARKSKLNEACNVKPLFNERLCAIVSNDDPLAKRDSVSFADLNDYMFYDFNIHPGCTESVYEAYANQTGAMPKKRRMNYIDSLSDIDLILQNMKPGYVYILALSIMLSSDPIPAENAPYAVLPFSDDHAYVDVCAITRKNESRQCVFDYVDILKRVSQEKFASTNLTISHCQQL